MLVLNRITKIYLIDNSSASTTLYFGYSWALTAALYCKKTFNWLALILSCALIGRLCFSYEIGIISNKNHLAYCFTIILAYIIEIT